MENLDSDYPPHLSEFYSIVVNNKDKENKIKPDIIRTDISTASRDNNKNIQTHKCNKSITSSINSNISCLQDLQIIITNKDIDQLINCLNQLKTISIKYAKTLEELSNDTSEFSDIINNLTRIKICPNDNRIIKNLLDSSGLFQIITNHHLLLSNSIKSYFISNLNEIINKIKKYYSKKYEEFNRFDQLQLVKLNQLKENYYKTNKNRFHNSHRFEENLIQIKRNLNDLQIQLNEMELNRFNYYNDLIDFNDKIFDDIINKLATISKIHLEINENIARKNWPDGGLNELLSYSDDDILFNNNNNNNIKEEEERYVENVEVHNNSNNNSLREELINNNNNITSSSSLEKLQNNSDNVNTTPLYLKRSKQSLLSNKGNTDMHNNHINNNNNNNNNMSDDSVEEEEEHDQSFSLPLTLSPTNNDNNNDGENEGIQIGVDPQQNNILNILDPGPGPGPDPDQSTKIIDQSSI